MSKTDRVLKRPELQEYMELYNQYLDGDLGSVGIGVTRIQEIERTLKEKGYNKIILALARDAVHTQRFQKRGKEVVK